MKSKIIIKLIDISLHYRFLFTFILKMWKFISDIYVTCTNMQNHRTYILNNFTDMKLYWKGENECLIRSEIWKIIIFLNEFFLDLVGMMRLLKLS